MSNEINITQAVKQLYAQEKAEVLMIVNEVLEETKDGASEELLAELSDLMNRVKKPINNIIHFPMDRVNRQKIGQVQLLAAAGQNLGSWYQQPLLFATAGFSVDVRKVIGSDNEVDVYLQALNETTDIVESFFTMFAGKSVKLTFTLNGQVLLEANIYVDGQDQRAEGSGHVYQAEIADIHGSLEVDVSL
jgi:hypothetical protein